LLDLARLHGSYSFGVMAVRITKSDL
jgi:hypothetical protein